MRFYPFVFTGKEHEEETNHGYCNEYQPHAAVDDKYFSYYVYDHSGGSCGSREQSQACLSYAEMEQRRRSQRRLKLTGKNELMDVNAEYMNASSVLNEPTLYPSAYMVLTNKGYTKHYYAGTERVAARLGGGGLNALHHAVGNNDTLQGKTDSLFDQSLEQVNSRVLHEKDLYCIMNNEFAKEEFGYWIEGIPYQMQAGVEFNHKQFRDVIYTMLDDPNGGKEKEVYFYHSDHLGSASWITDSIGIPIQHLQYLPYGEPYINQHPFGYSERFTFTGKERDEETGFGYFGARYMDHSLLTSFISVDRYADKYPFISPYAYCAWNPIRLIDPTGDTICINGQHYTPGMSSDGLDEFSKKAVDALNTMYGTDEGRSLIDNLGSSDNIFTIEEAATSEFKPIDRRRASLAQLKTDPYGQKEYQGLLDIGFDFNGGSGGTILWNSAGSILPTEEGGKVCATTDLAHEMFHALDANQGLLDHRDEKGIPRKEWQAVYRENILRGQMGLPLRTHYRKQMTSNGEFVGGSGEMMISGGKPIKPSWY